MEENGRGVFYSTFPAFAGVTNSKHIANLCCTYYEDEFQ